MKEDENEDELALLSFSTDWPRENTKHFHIKKTLLNWENENDEIFWRETLLLQKYLMLTGEMDRQWKTLKRKRMVNLKFILLVLLKSFGVKVNDFL